MVQTRSKFSPALWILLAIYWVLWVTSPIFWAELWYEKGARRLPYWCVELWVLLNLMAQAIALFVLPAGHIAAGAIAIYGLVGLTAALLRDAIASPLKHTDDQGGYISIRNRPRWMVLAFLGLVQTILCFSIIFFARGDQFEPALTDPLTAVYYSTVTLTTLGYGDVKPICSLGRMLVIGELFFFILFLGIRLPLAVSVLRVQVKDST